MSLLTWTVSDGGVHHAAFGRGPYSVARMHGRAIEVEKFRAKQQRKKISASDASIAEQGTDTVYKIVDVVGVSTESGKTPAAMR